MKIPWWDLSPDFFFQKQIKICKQQFREAFETVA